MKYYFKFDVKKSSQFTETILGTNAEEEITSLVDSCMIDHCSYGLLFCQSCLQGSSLACMETHRTVGYVAEV